MDGRRQLSGRFRCSYLVVHDGMVSMRSSRGAHLFLFPCNARPDTLLHLELTCPTRFYFVSDLSSLRE